MIESTIIESNNNVERIVELLFRRGFLIDKTDYGYMLSDNSAKEDNEYLNSVLHDYQLGYLNSDGIIVINNPQNADCLFELFYPKKDGIGIEELDVPNGWPQFKSRAHGIKVPTQSLEANIALYIKAISAAGFMTNACCDGNHSNKKRLYIKFQSPFDLWHEFLWKEYLGKPFKLSWISDKDHLASIYFSEWPKTECYDLLFKAGSYIYKNRQLLRFVRLSASSFLSTHKDIRGKNRTKADEIENFSIFLERVRPLLADSSFGKDIV